MFGGAINRLNAFTPRCGQCFGVQERRTECTDLGVCGAGSRAEVTAYESKVSSLSEGGLREDGDREARLAAVVRVTSHG